MKQLIITPEERAEIRRRFEILRRGHPITGSFSLGVHMDGYLRNYAHGFEVNFIGLLDALEQAEAENARLTKALETQRNLTASAHATAEAAWGGEIPSPFPGHKPPSEDTMVERFNHLNCPLCGGSGHIDDCDKTSAEEIARLTKMVDWLAELVFDRPCAYACCPFDKHRPTGPDDDDCDKTHIQCWAEAASRAVAAGEG